MGPGRPELVQGERRVVGNHCAARGEPEPRGNDVFVRAGGHPDESVEATADPFEVARYRDEQIAAVLNRSGYRTGKDKRWNQTRVFTGRNRCQIPDSPLDGDVLHADAAARYCGVSIMAIRRLVAIGVLKSIETSGLVESPGVCETLCRRSRAQQPCYR